MAAPWRDISYPRVFFVVLTLFVGVTLLVGGVSSTTVFGAYNPAWDGVSELRSVADSEEAETVVLQDTSRYDSTNESSTLSIVLSPGSNYTSREGARVERFVRNGGTLVVAEDVGSASNPLLEEVGADARVPGSLLRDERFNDDSPELPVANNVTNHTYTAGVERLTLNRGTSVEPNGAEVLINSSSYAYLDKNANGELDESEALEQRPVVTVESVGQGSVVVLGDPSIFINVMLDRPDNRPFARNLVGSHQTIVFDVSHVAALPPLIGGQLLLQRTPAVQLALGLTLVVLVSFWGWPVVAVERVREWVGSPALPRDGRESSPDRATVRQFVQTRYPEWDDERVQRVTEGIIRKQQKDQSDD